MAELPTRILHVLLYELESGHFAARAYRYLREVLSAVGLF